MMMLRKVIFNGVDKGRSPWGSCDDADKALVSGRVYGVRRVKQTSTTTRIKLIGIDGWFNPFDFSDAI